MNNKIVIIVNTFHSYQMDRFINTTALLKGYNFTTYGIELSHQGVWHSSQQRINSETITTLFSNNLSEKLDILFHIYRTWQALTRINPDVITTCGYDLPAYLTALAWAKKWGKKAILMSDSKFDDSPRRSWKEFVKRGIVGLYSAALVGGKPQREYLISLGMPADRVFVGFDVVDNKFFALKSGEARKHEYQKRSQLGLPRPYFLTVCRLIECKNLFRLLEAYRHYRRRTHANHWDLVICGSGPLEARLKIVAKDLPGVHFSGFIQANEIPVYYGLASVFILPSISETWGLVINEAMASALPVLVSKACGCAPDLVQEGINGFTFDPEDIERLAHLMMKISSEEVDRKSMGKASNAIISNWTLETYAENLLKAIDVATNNHNIMKR